MYVHLIVIMRTFHFYSEKTVRDHNIIGVSHSYSCDDSSTQTDLTMSDIDVLDQIVKRLNGPDKLMRDFFIKNWQKMIQAFSSTQDSHRRRYLLVHLVNIPQLNIYRKISTAKFAENNIFFPLNLCPKYNWTTMQYVFSCYSHRYFRQILSRFQALVSSIQLK